MLYFLLRDVQVSVEYKPRKLYAAETKANVPDTLAGSKVSLSEMEDQLSDSRSLPVAVEASAAAKSSTTRGVFGSPINPSIGTGMISCSLNKSSLDRLLALSHVSSAAASARSKSGERLKNDSAVTIDPSIDKARHSLQVMSLVKKTANSSQTDAVNDEPGLARGVRVLSFS